MKFSAFNMQKGYSLPTIVIVIAILLIGAGVYFFSRNNTTPPKTQETPVSSQDASREPNGSAETANWKTYINNKYNYSFKYPPNADLKEGGMYSADGVFAESNKLTSLTYTIDEQEVASVGGIRGFQFSISVEDNKDNLTLDQLKKELVFHEGDLDLMRQKIKNTMIDQYPALGGDVGGIKGQYTFISVNQGKIYRFNFEPRISPTGEKILSTFKFTDQSQTLDTSNWKTYTNDKYGFSIQYPSNIEVTTPVQPEGFLVDVNLKNEVGKCLGGTNIDLFTISIGRYSSIEKYKSSTASFSPTTPFQKTSFNGEQAIQHYYPGSSQTGGPQVSLFFIHNGVDYEILYRFCAKPGTILNDSEITNMSPNILSTFKFIN